MAASAVHLRPFSEDDLWRCERAAAQRLLVDHRFATTPRVRIWAGTEVDNVAEQKALERCGFRREGLLRSNHFRAGRRRDAYVYGLLRSDPR